jgi:DNA-directed RNA polymerase specialized sigma24 family protein
MNKNKEQLIYNVAVRLFENAGKLKYGEATATLIVHEGKIKKTYHETRETIRECEEVQDGTVC